MPRPGGRSLGERGLDAYVAVACALLIAPIAIVIVLAFSGQAFLKFPPDSLSLRWFDAFFGDARWRASLGLSVAIALIACAVATTLGFLAAYAFVRSEMRAKTFLLSKTFL